MITSQTSLKIPLSPVSFKSQGNSRFGRLTNDADALFVLVLREKGKERLYSLADPNWNVVAICDTAGSVKERYTYDAFGKRNATEFDWNRAFTGQVLDAETGLMLYRNRYYSTELERFVTRDPIGYEAGDRNVYRYVSNSTLVMTDWTGLSGGFPLYVYPKKQCCKKYKLVQRKGKEFRTNGCTGVSDEPLNKNYSFASACNAHDICYEICGASKAGCDVSFLNNMYAICDELGNGPLKSNCRGNAYSYYIGVYWAGWNAFSSTQSTGKNGWCERVCDD